MVLCLLFCQFLKIAADSGSYRGLLGLYERIPELHSLELASAPFIQLTFRLIWGVVSYSPTITKNDLILAEKTCLKGQNRGVQIRTLPVYPQSS